MPSLRLFEEQDSYDLDGYRALAFQLEAFRTNDYATAMQDEVTAVFARTPLQLRYLPLVESYCKQKGSLYVASPARTFGGVSERDAGILAEVYERSFVDAFLEAADQKSHAHNGLVILATPHPRDPLRVVLNSYHMGEADDEFVDLQAQELRDAAKLTLRVPIERLPYGDVRHARMVITPTEAYIEGPSGRIPAPGFPDGVNRLGYIPAVGVRHCDPLRGRWFPTPPQDLNSVQIGLILGVSHIEAICRHKVTTREGVIGQGAANAVKRQMYGGADGLMALNAGAEELKWFAHDPQPAVEKYWTAIKTTLELLASYKQMSAGGLWSGAGITGDAKEMERASGGMLTEERRLERRWCDTERRLGAIVADVVSRGNRGTLTVGTPRVVVEHNRVEPRRNGLQEMQALALGSFLGLPGALEWVARHETAGDTDQAADKVRGRLERLGEVLESWRGQTPPGLDSIATNIMNDRMGTDEAAPDA